MSAYSPGYCELILAFIVGCSIYTLTMKDKEFTPNYPTARAYNKHWQQTQDRKLAFCYQRMETMPEVNRCMLKYGVFI